jgi:VWFA-related protein
MRTLFVSLIVVGAFAMPAGVASQQPPPQGPTFKGGVELITVDVGVLDRNGRPVEDLTTADFTVKINGETRRVVTAELVKVDLEQARKRAADPTEAYYSSNIAPANGRQIIIAVDQLYVSPSGVKPIMNAAIQFLNRLTPLDSVAFVAFPEPGPRANFTTDKFRVRQAMQGIVGQNTMKATLINMGVSEALDINNRRDQNVLREVSGRVCSGALDGTERDRCVQGIIDEAARVTSRNREDVRISLTQIETLLRALAYIEGHKSLILISQSLAIRDHTELDTAIRLAGPARTSINVLAVDLGRDDVTINERPPTPMEDRRIQLEGLEELAAASRGALYRVVNTGEGIFDRLASELSAHYVLGVEQRPSDQKRDRHRVDVSMRRRDVTIRSGQAFVLSPTLNPKRSVQETIQEALSSPMAQSGVPLRVTTFAQRDKGDKVRLTLAAQVGQPGTPPGEFTVAYAIVSNENRLVASDGNRYKLAANAGSSNEPLHFSTAAVLDPGLYSLRFAVVDAEGRRGSVSRDLTVFKMEAEEFATSDLIIGNQPPAGQGMRPNVEPHITGDRLAAYLELYSKTPETLAATTVAFEIASDEGTTSLTSQPAQIGDSPQPPGRVATGVINTGTLAPGRYLVHAKMTRDGKTVGVLMRPFVLERAEAAAVDPAAK